jgi:hypothetical protein
MILEDRVVDRLNDAASFGGIRELRVVFAHFFAEKESAFLFQGFVREFLAAGLDREIGLAERDNLFSGVGVLDD